VGACSTVPLPCLKVVVVYEMPGDGRQRRALLHPDSIQAAGKHNQVRRRRRTTQPLVLDGTKNEYTAVHCQVLPVPTTRTDVHSAGMRVTCPPIFSFENPTQYVSCLLFYMVYFGSHRRQSVDVAFSCTCCTYRGEYFGHAG